jgi:hypothetical protein
MSIRTEWKLDWTRLAITIPMLPSYSWIKLSEDRRKDVKRHQIEDSRKELSNGTNAT